MNRTNICYLSLGDSIAAGYVDPFRQTVPYPVLLQGMLSRLEKRPVRLFTFARNGITSQGLLTQVLHSAALQEQIARADLITLCIGGNDLLQAASVPGFASISVSKAERGLACFCRCFPLLTQRLRALNPRAVLIGATLYNPYLQCERQLYETTARFLAPLNNTVKSQIPAVDLNALLTGRPDRLCMYPVGLLRNPHPSPCGQRMIADAFFQEYCRQRENRI